MLDPKFFDDIVKQLNAVLPSDLRHLGEDIEKKFRAILQDGFAKLDLVTREEFDVQKQVLVRTRSKLEAMEKQLAELDKGGVKKTKMKKVKSKEEK